MNILQKWPATWHCQLPQGSFHRVVGVQVCAEMCRLSWKCDICAELGCNCGPCAEWLLFPVVSYSCSQKQSLFKHMSVKAVLNWKRTRVLTSTASNRCFLIDLMSTSWCLDFARTYSWVSSSELRHQKRKRRIWQGGGTQIQARRGKHADSGSGSICVWRPREEQARGEEQDTDFGCMWVGTCWKYRRKVQKTQQDLFGNPAWKLSVLHTHTHTHLSLLTV